MIKIRAAKEMQNFMSKKSETTLTFLTRNNNVKLKSNRNLLITQQNKGKELFLKLSQMRYGKDNCFILKKV